jgi:hypothetical protein
MARLERKSLLDIFLSRLRKDAPAKPAPSSVAPRPFQAVSIFHGAKSCDVAKRFSDYRFLSKDAPQLPLSGCSMPERCQCRFLKHKDRRTDRRRLVEFAAASRGFMGQERRQRGGRRSND